jgi:hypothetical protein
MYLDGGFLNSVLDQEGRYLVALVSLQLNDFAHLLVLDKSAVACKLLQKWYCLVVRDDRKFFAWTSRPHLLESLEELLRIIHCHEIRSSQSRPIEAEC